MDVSCDECDMAPYLSTPCQISVGADVIPLLSLDPPLDPENKKFSVPSSTVILSRVCVNYLSSRATFSDWSICLTHRAELLDQWRPSPHCCHHQHSEGEQGGPRKMGSVTLAMSKTILKGDGMVLPIGGTVCGACKESYIRQYIPGLTRLRDFDRGQDNRFPPQNTKETTEADHVSTQAKEKSGASEALPLPPVQVAQISSGPDKFVSQEKELNQNHESNLDQSQSSPVQRDLKEFASLPSSTDMPSTSSIFQSVTSDSLNPLLCQTLTSCLTLSSSPHPGNPPDPSLSSRSPTNISNPLVHPTVRSSPSDNSNLQISQTPPLSSSSDQSSISSVLQNMKSIQPSYDPTSSLVPQTPTRSVPRPTSPAQLTSVMLTPEEIRRKIASLNPLQVVRSNSSPSGQKFVILQPSGEAEAVSGNQESSQSPFLESSVLQQVRREAENIVQTSGGRRQANMQVRRDLLQTVISPVRETDIIIINDGARRQHEVVSLPASISNQAPAQFNNPSSAAAASSSASIRNRSLNNEVTLEEENNEASENDNMGDEYKFYCKLCHIGFLKETSYKYHFANNIELHRKVKKQKDCVRKCDDCGKKFTNDKEFRKHLYNDHKVDDPFFCKICNIILKNESAYKSHHSKLHLERRIRIFYCRECEDIFNCKVTHQEHIRTHWVAINDSTGFQCPTCGKLFGQGNRSAYSKHLATHDEDSQKPCECAKCSKSPTKETNIDKEKSTKIRIKRKSTRIRSMKSSKKRRADILDSITESFNETVENQEYNEDDPDEVNEDGGVIDEVHDEFEPESMSDEENDEEENNQIQDKRPTMTVNCGVCGETFEHIDLLEKHIDSKHGSDEADKKISRLWPFVAKEGGWKCHLCHLVLRTSRALKTHKSKKECSVLREASNEDDMVRISNPQPPPSNSNPKVISVKSNSSQASTGTSVPTMKTNFNALWQQSESRNWAAEFGYGKNNEEHIFSEPKSKKIKGTENKSSKNSNQKEPVKPIDILSAMKENFTANMNDESSDDEDESYLYGSRKTDGRNLVMANRSPRVLSQASRQTRKRLELLTKQAQALMKQKEKSKAKSKPNSDESNQPSQDATKSVSDNTNSSNNNVVENSDSDDDLNADINNEDDLLIPLSNGWVCEKRRDPSGKEGYVTNYWSPEGDQFNTKEDIEKHVTENDLSVDMTAFDAADINVEQPTKTTGTGFSHLTSKVTSVRVKDDETGLPMVIIFPGGRDCLTMDVSATA